MPLCGGTALRDVYDAAHAGGYGYVASNVTHPEIAYGLLAGAEATDTDLVLQVKRDTLEYLGRGDVAAGLATIGDGLAALAGDVGVFLNVDHVDAGDEELRRVATAASAPASIMIDASDRPFEENVAETRAAVKAVRANGDALVEAELGTIAGTESGHTTDDAAYTDPAEAVAFVERTGCDLLAVSIGTEHGVAAGRDLDLRIELAEEIDAALRSAGLDVPLVVHGSSGLSAEQVAALLETGVCKLNVNTRYQYEYARVAAAFYDEHAAAIVPPGDVSDDRERLFADADWSPDRGAFDPRVVGRQIRDRIATVHAELAGIAGSRGRSQYT